MESSKLGDTYDEYKALTLNPIHDEQLWNDLRVDPMATDHWLDEHWTSYAEVLRVDTKAIIHHDDPYPGEPKRYKNSGTTAQQNKYWTDVITAHTGDLFLDPNIGIATWILTERDNPQNFIFEAKLFALLDAKPQRLVAVYQHVRQEKTDSRISRLLCDQWGLRSRNARLWCCSCEAEGGFVMPSGRKLAGGGVAILFFSLNVERIQAVYDCLEKALPTEAPRIRFWRSTETSR